MTDFKDSTVLPRVINNLIIRQLGIPNSTQLASKIKYVLIAISLLDSMNNTWPNNCHYYLVSWVPKMPISKVQVLNKFSLTLLAIIIPLQIIREWFINLDYLPSYSRWLQIWLSSFSWHRRCSSSTFSYCTLWLLRTFFNSRVKASSTWYSIRPQRAYSLTNWYANQLQSRSMWPLWVSSGTFSGTQAP
jgi:hypothetical protein